VIDVPFPVIVPDEIPTIDLTRSAAAGIEFGPRDAGAFNTGSGDPALGSGDGIPFAAGVDKPALALHGNPTPRYPDILRRANVGGEVVIQVVIDTTGRADVGTARVLSSDHELLTNAVLATLPAARFLPAESGGRKVRMWAVQSFVFEVK
jgi:protein TonB